MICNVWCNGGVMKWSNNNNDEMIIMKMNNINIIMIDNGVMK